MADQHQPPAPAAGNTPDAAEALSHIGRSVTALLGRTRRALSPWLQRLVEAQPTALRRARGEATPNLGLRRAAATPFRFAMRPPAIAALGVQRLGTKVMRKIDRTAVWTGHLGSLSPAAVDNFVSRVAERFPPIAGKYQIRPMGEGAVQRSEMPFVQTAPEAAAEPQFEEPVGEWPTVQPAPSETSVLDELPPLAPGESLTQRLRTLMEAGKQSVAAPIQRSLDDDARRFSPRQISRRASTTRVVRGSGEGKRVRRSVIEEVAPSGSPEPPAPPPSREGEPAAAQLRQQFEPPDLPEPEEPRAAELTAPEAKLGRPAVQRLSAPVKHPTTQHPASPSEHPVFRRASATPPEKPDEPSSPPPEEAPPSSVPPPPPAPPAPSASPTVVQRAVEPAEHQMPLHAPAPRAEPPSPESPPPALPHETEPSRGRDAKPSPSAGPAVPRPEVRPVEPPAPAPAQRRIDQTMPLRLPKPPEVSPEIPAEPRIEVTPRVEAEIEPPRAPTADRPAATIRRRPAEVETQPAPQPLVRRKPSRPKGPTVLHSPAKKSSLIFRKALARTPMMVQRTLALPQARSEFQPQAEPVAPPMRPEPQPIVRRPAETRAVALPLRMPKPAVQRMPVGERGVEEEKPLLSEVAPLQRSPAPPIQRLKKSGKSGGVLSWLGLSHDEAPAEPDYDELARKVLPLIRRMLAIERERR